MIQVKFESDLVMSSDSLHIPHSDYNMYRKMYRFINNNVNNAINKAINHSKIIHIEQNIIEQNNGIRIHIKYNI